MRPLLAACADVEKPAGAAVTSDACADVGRHERVWCWRGVGVGVPASPQAKACQGSPPMAMANKEARKR